MNESHMNAQVRHLDKLAARDAQARSLYLQYREDWLRDYAQVFARADLTDPQLDEYADKKRERWEKAVPGTIARVERELGFYWKAGRKLHLSEEAGR